MNSESVFTTTVGRHQLTIATGKLAEQAGGIITPLKTFARKSPAVSVAVDVAQAVDAALFLLSLIHISEPTRPY